MTARLHKLAPICEQDIERENPCVTRGNMLVARDRTAALTCVGGAATGELVADNVCSRERRSHA
eukprot:1986447-Prymnesium_polylepis.1